MDSKSDVLSCETVACIAGILRLIPKTRNPDYITGSIATDLVDDGLEIQLHVLEMTVTITGICSVRSLDMDRLIRELEHDLAVVLQLLML